MREQYRWHHVLTYSIGHFRLMQALFTYQIYMAAKLAHSDSRQLAKLKKKIKQKRL